MIAILIVSNFLIVSTLLAFEFFVRRKHLFYPTVLFLGFSFINSFVSLYYLYNPAIIYNGLSEHIDFSLVNELFFLYLCVNVFVYFLFFIFLSSPFRVPLTAQDLFGSKITMSQRNAFLSVVLFVLSILVYLYFVVSVGGFSVILSNISARQDVYAGHGYLMRFSVIFLQFSCLLSYFKMYSISRVVSFTLVSVSVALLLLLGSRMSAFGLLFSVMVLHHFAIKPLRLRIYYAPLIITFIVVAVILGDLRTSGLAGLKNQGETELDLNSFFKSLLPYTVPLQRDLTILDYFSRNDYWYGASYYSVLAAPIPRSKFEDKPPVDTGRYVVAMYSGMNIDPPAPSDDLPNYGWPPSLMEGYMNYGYGGLLVIVFISVLVSSFAYKMILLRPSVPIFIIYSSLMFNGVTYFDSLSVVSVLTLVGMLLFIVSVVKALIGVFR